MPTKKVKIALSITDEGEWVAAGYSNNNSESTIEEFEADLLSMTIEGVDAIAYKLYWVEVEVPIPEVKDIEKVYGVLGEVDNDA